MKKVAVFLVLFLIMLFTQHANAEVKSRIVFNDGMKISGVIIESKYSDSISIQLGGGFIVSYPKNSVKEIVSLRKSVSIGIGYGIPYGILGINTEIEPVKYLNFTSGIGTTIFAGLAWNVGAVGYFLDQDSYIRPRISLFYGTNSMLGYDSWNSSNDIYESFPGLSLGAGLKIMLGESSATTLDLIYLLTNGASDRQKELEKVGYRFEEVGIPIKLSAGYQFSF
jgi:hypothetical protein